MSVLIVESEKSLAQIWRRHLERFGMTVSVAYCQESAIRHLSENEADILIMNLVLENGSALAVADYASYRLPEARVIFVTNTTFFSDGSIFSFAPNACAYVQSSTPPDDIAAIAEHYGPNEEVVAP
jgi:DNA-binding NtrC family response regulator